MTHIEKAQAKIAVGALAFVVLVITAFAGTVYLLFTV